MARLRAALVLGIVILPGTCFSAAYRVIALESWAAGAGRIAVLAVGAAAGEVGAAAAAGLGVVSLVVSRLAWVSRKVQLSRLLRFRR